MCNSYHNPQLSFTIMPGIQSLILLVLSRTNEIRTWGHDNHRSLPLRAMPLSHLIRRYHSHQVFLIATGTHHRSVLSTVPREPLSPESQGSRLPKQPLITNLKDFLQVYQSGLSLKCAVKAPPMLMRSFLNPVSTAIIVEAGDKKQARPVERWKTLGACLARQIVVPIESTIKLNRQAIALVLVKCYF